MTEMAKNFTKETCMPNGRILLSVDLLRPYWGNVLTMLGPYCSIRSHTSVASNSLAKPNVSDTVCLHCNVAQNSLMLIINHICVELFLIALPY